MFIKGYHCYKYLGVNMETQLFNLGRLDLQYYNFVFSISVLRVEQMRGVTGLSKFC